MNSDNCCPQNIRMCTQDELRTGRFSNPNTRCDPCALGPYGRPQICPMTGLPCPAVTNENTCRAPDGKCITVCDGQNCCANNIPMCTDEDLRGRFSNANTRCNPCAMGPDGSPQRCPLTGQPCPQSNPQNSCRVINNDGTMNCITLCDGSRPGPRPIPPGPRPIPPGPFNCHICNEVGGMVRDDPNTCIRFDPNHPNASNCCCEAGQICLNEDNLPACKPVWAKEQVPSSSSCPPGFVWPSTGSQVSGLPCVKSPY